MNWIGWAIVALFAVYIVIAVGAFLLETATRKERDYDEQIASISCNTAKFKQLRHSSVHSNVHRFS